VPLLEVRDEIDVNSPILVLAISGWVDGGLVATHVGEYLTDLGKLVAVFSPDDIYDYQSHRPSLELAAGATEAIEFPALSVHTVSIDGVDLIVTTGTEPNFKWQGVATELTDLAGALGATRVVSVGAVPAMVAHSRPTPVIVTSTDPLLEAVGMPADRLVVPAALTNVVAHRVASANSIPDVGFWAQVPHYVSGVYWPGVDSVLTRMASHLGMTPGLDVIRARALDLISRLDEAVSASPDAQRFIAELEASTPGFAVDESGRLGDEIEEYLRSLGEDDPD
jgi:hypothetical protein